MDYLEKNRLDLLVLETLEHCFVCSSTEKDQNCETFSQCNEDSSLSELDVMEISPLCTLLKINKIEMVELAMKQKAPNLLEPNIVFRLCKNCAASYAGIKEALLELNENLKTENETEIKRKLYDHLDAFSQKLNNDLSESCLEQIATSAFAFNMKKFTFVFREEIKNQAIRALKEMKKECGLEATPGLVFNQPMVGNMNIQGSNSNSDEPNKPLGFTSINATSVIDNDAQPSLNFAFGHGSGFSATKPAVLLEKGLPKFQSTCSTAIKGESNPSSASSAIQMALESNGSISNHYHSARNVNAKKIAGKCRPGPASRTGRPPYPAGKNKLNEEFNGSFSRNLSQVTQNQNERSVLDSTINIAGPSRQIDISITGFTKTPNQSLIKTTPQTIPKELDGIQNNQLMQSEQALPIKDVKTATVKHIPTKEKAKFRKLSPTSPYKR